MISFVFNAILALMLIACLPAIVAVGIVAVWRVVQFASLCAVCFLAFGGWLWIVAEYVANPGLGWILDAPFFALWGVILYRLGRGKAREARAWLDARRKMGPSQNGVRA